MTFVSILQKMLTDKPSGLQSCCYEKASRVRHTRHTRSKREHPGQADAREGFIQSSRNAVKILDAHAPTL